MNLGTASMTNDRNREEQPEHWRPLMCRYGLASGPVRLANGWMGGNGVDTLTRTEERCSEDGWMGWEAGSECLAR